MERAEQKKLDHYELEIADLPRSSTFFPFSLSTLGGRGPKAKQVVQLIAPILAQRLVMSVSKTFDWIYRLLGTSMLVHEADNLSAVLRNVAFKGKIHLRLPALWGV